MKKKNTDIDLVIENWIVCQKSFWAYEYLSDLSQTDPIKSLQIMIEILETDDSDEIQMVLAAGPLEDLLNNFGEQIIALIEKECSQNPKLRNLLGGVWKSEIADNVWKKIIENRSNEW